MLARVATPYILYFEKIISNEVSLSLSLTTNLLSFVNGNLVQKLPNQNTMTWTPMGPVQAAAGRSVQYLERDTALGHWRLCVENIPPPTYGHSFVLVAP